MFGLAALRRPPAAALAEPEHAATPLDVGLDLLLAGEPLAAAEQLEEVAARQDLSPSQRAHASLALARAQALADRPAEGRATLLALADRAPRQAKEALLLAAGLAEEAGDAAAACGDLRRIQTFYPLTEAEQVEVGRRLRRLEPLTRFREQVRIDAEALAAGRLPFRVREPLLLRRAEDGLRLYGSRPRRGPYWRCRSATRAARSGSRPRSSRSTCPTAGP